MKLIEIITSKLPNLKKGFYYYINNQWELTIKNDKKDIDILEEVEDSIGNKYYTKLYWNTIIQMDYYTDINKIIDIIKKLKVYVKGKEVSIFEGE